jgi:hypothetical protein
MNCQEERAGRTEEFGACAGTRGRSPAQPGAGAIKPAQTETGRPRGSGARLGLGILEVALDAGSDLEGVL